MNLISCRAFLMAKCGLSATHSADSISVDEKSLRFAIADGVTQSYFPEYFSRALTKAFIERSDSAGSFFQSPGIADTFKKVIFEWKTQIEESKQNADEFTKSLYDERWHDYPFGATTFAGVTMEDDTIEVVSIGDSCVFIIPDDKNLSPSMITSMPHSITDENSIAYFKCDFGTRPHVLNTEGYLSVEPVVERVVPGTCWLLMMTDALAEWFVNNYNKDDYQSRTLSCLLSLSNQNEFEDFIKSNRVSEVIKDDDTSLIIVRLESNSKEDTNDVISDESSDTQVLSNLTETEIPSVVESNLVSERSSTETIRNDKEYTKELIENLYKENLITSEPIDLDSDNYETIDESTDSQFSSNSIEVDNSSVGKLGMISEINPTDIIRNDDEEYRKDLSSYINDEDGNLTVSQPSTLDAENKEYSNPKSVIAKETESAIIMRLKEFGNCILVWAKLLKLNNK